MLQLDKRILTLADAIATAESDSEKAKARRTLLSAMQKSGYTKDDLLIALRTRDTLANRYNAASLPDDWGKRVPKRPNLGQYDNASYSSPGTGGSPLASGARNVGGALVYSR